MMVKNFIYGCNRKFLATIIAVAIVISGVSITPKQVAEAAPYTVQYSSIPNRTVDVTDGQAVEKIDGVGEWVLTLPATTIEAAHDKNGVVWMRYFNGKLGAASYELEGANLVYHKYYEPGSQKQACATEFLFLGENKKYVTHYKDNNGTIIPLPEVDYLRDLWGIAAPVTPSPAPTMTVPPMPTSTPVVTQTPTVSPTASPTVSPTATPTVSPTATPTVSPTASPTVPPMPTSTPNITIDIDKETHTDVDISLKLKELEEKIITWQQIVKELEKTTWRTETIYGETSETWKIYDDKGNEVYSKTVTTGTTTEQGKGDKTTEEKTDGNAKVDTEKEITGEGKVTIDTKEKEDIKVTDKRPATSSSTAKQYAHVHKSGSKSQWISKNGNSRYTATFKGGKLKLRTLKGKQVKMVDYIKNTETALVTFKDKTGLLVNLKNMKMVWIKEKIYEKYRSKKTNFLSSVALKNGRKVDMKNAKVKDGKNSRNVKKVKAKKSIFDLIK